MILSDETVLATLRNAGGLVTTRELQEFFDLRKNERAELREILRSLESRGYVEQLRGRFWRVVAKRSKNQQLTGSLEVNRKGFGFVRLDDEQIQARGKGVRDVLVQEWDLGDALSGDRVAVEIVQRGPTGWRGVITEVLERANKKIVGRYQRIGSTHGEVIPRNPAIQRMIRVPLPDKGLDVKTLEWVVVDITQFTPFPDSLQGKITERLGASHEKGIDVLLLLRDRGIVEEFPATVERAAEKLALDVAAEIPRRRDCRDLVTVTIDPETAKDFDDAMSIEPLGKDGWRLWVHIADVTHYVRPGDAIDDEARERSTSVYPVDRVVPMLPEKLSNDLCSLRPQVDRLTMTAEMIVKPNGELGECDFYSSIIHSNQRLTYEQVQAVYENEDGARDAIVPEALPAIEALRACTEVLRRTRFKRGALDLDIPETKISFHEEGQVRDLGFRERFEAHRVVEDCMLAANEAVAQAMTRRSVPFLYRVHEQADPERLERLRPMLKALGVSLPVEENGAITPHGLQLVLKSIEHREGGHILRRLILRALKRAEYTPRNAGHFGLASKCYCHFTSPIRRYPDVVVHRQLRAMVEDKPLPYPNDDDGKAELAELARHTSFKEREAADAEWESTKIKAIEYMKQFEGDEFEGIVCGVQNFGLFVELKPSGVEGLVPIRTLVDDRYDLDELGIQLVGRKSGRRFRLMDKVNVKIVRADAFASELDLELVQDGNRFVARAAKGRGREQGRKNPFIPPKKVLKKSRKKKR